MRLVSRRKLAKYAAEQILAGNDAVLEEIAGFLIYEKHAGPSRPRGTRGRARESSGAGPPTSLHGMI